MTSKIFFAFFVVILHNNFTLGCQHDCDSNWSLSEALKNEKLYNNKLEDIPPFFRKEDFDRCNLTGSIYLPVVNDIQPLKFECSRYLCLLKANDLLRSDFSVDDGALRTLLEQYAAGGGAGGRRARAAARHCAGAAAAGACAADRLVHCLVITHSLGYLTGNFSMPGRCLDPAGTAEPCCRAPPLFPPVTLEGCGLWRGREIMDGRGLPEPPAFYLHLGCRVKYPTIPCPKERCMLNKHNLIDDDGNLKIDSVHAYLDDYAKVNPTYKQAIDVAKNDCVVPIDRAAPAAAAAAAAAATAASNAGTAPGINYVCESQKFIHCVTSVMAHECPSW